MEQRRDKKSEDSFFPKNGQENDSEVNSFEETDEGLPESDTSKSGDHGAAFSGASEEGEINTETNEEVDTLRDFLENLKWRYDLAHDMELKQKLAHQMVKIEIALGAAGLGSHEVYVRQTPEGILGYYEPEANRIAISSGVLEDFSSDQTLFNTILVHEKTHKEGIHDEGLTQKLVMKKIHATPGIYPAERKQAEFAFHRLGVDAALELYEIASPEDLADGYLRQELEKIWKEKLEFQYKKSKKKNTRERIESISRHEIELLEKKFEEGVPRLSEALEARGYSFREKIFEILGEYVEEKT